MKRRILAIFLSLCMLVGLLPVVALASDGESGTVSSAACSCETLCAEEAVNVNCPVCVEDYSLCAYVAPDNEEELVSCTKMEGCTLEDGHEGECMTSQDETSCICETVCMEETVNENCPVCMEDHAHCAYVAPDDEEEPVSCTKIEGCTLEDGHEGKCMTSQDGPVCAMLDGCGNDIHAVGCPQYVEPADDTLQEQAQEEPATQPVTSTESTSDLLSGTASSSTSQNLEGAEGSVLTWKLTEGVLTISGTGAMKDYGYSGRTEVPWYDQRSTITKVIFGDGVTHIGSFAFFQHTNLTSFEMTNSMVSFGQGAFQGCSALTTIPKLHENFQDFSTEVFVDTQIEAYEVESANPYYIVKDGILYSKDGTTLVNCPPGKVDVFDPNWLNGVTTIAPYAFRTCRSLTGTLQIPAHITSIGRQAFQNCSSLTGDLTVPNTVTDLDGYYTFAGMTSMTGKLTLESNITEIPGGMFNGSGFTSMEWQGKVTSVDNNAFTGCKFTGFALPESVTTVGDRAFQNCAANGSAFGSLEHLSSIGTYAFGGCDLGSIFISKDAEVATNAFNGATITSVTYNAPTLTKQVFNGATVNTFTLMDNVTYIGAGNFTKAGSVSASLRSVQTIEASAFKGATLTTDISIPAGATVGSNAFENATLKNVSYNAETASYAVFKGATMNSLTLGDNTTEIAANAFQKSHIGGDALKLGKVKTIEKYAFSEAQLPATVIIPETATDYNNHVFYGTEGGKTLLIYGSYNMVPTALTHDSEFETVVITADIENNDEVTYGDNQKAHNRLTSMTDGHIIYMTNDTSRQNAEVPNSNGAVGVTNGGTFAEDTKFDSGTLAHPIKDGFIFDGWYTEDGTNDIWGEKVSDITLSETYYAKWTESGYNISPTSLDFGSVSYGSAVGAQKITVEGTGGTGELTAESSNDNIFTAEATDGSVNVTLVETLIVGTYSEVITITTPDGATFSVPVIISVNAADSPLSITPSVTSLVGGGTVTLTVDKSKLPEGAVVTVTGNNGVTITENNGTYTVNLPNTNATYTFIASYAGDANHAAASASCIVSVTRRSSGGGSSSSSGGSHTTSSSDDVSITVSDDNVTTSQMESAVNKADEGSTITVKATSSKNITLPVDGLRDVVDNDNDVLVQFRYGEITLSTRAIEGMIDGTSSNEKIKVSITKNDDSTDEIISELQNKDIVAFDVSVNVEDKNIHSFDGSLTLTFTVPDLSEISDPHILHILNDGTKEYYVPDRISGNTITVKGIYNLSTFAVIPGSSVPTNPVNPFVDVYESDYYYDAVLWAVNNDVTSGTSATTFGPNAVVTRAQMVTFLWRAHGAPKTVGSNPFTDVSESDYYYDAVLWAVTNGVTSGTSATTFSPDMEVTRAQAVTFQWRAADSPMVSGNKFGDVVDNAYYVNAVAWAVANEITSGTSATTFSPDMVVTRAQAVTFLYRELA